MHQDVLYWVIGSEIVQADISFTSFYSLFNSPYPAHRMGTAVDLYFSIDEALFPFEEGIILDIRWYNVPRKRVDALDKEPLILIRLSSITVAKILHVYPKVRIGERIYFGDPIGKLIISGFMYPWSEKHMHLEVRPLWDPVRATGASRVKMLRATNVPATNRIEGIIVEKNEYYLLVKPKNTISEGLTPLTIHQGGYIHSIEGGIPHYGYAGLLTTTSRDYKNMLNLGTYNALLMEIKWGIGAPGDKCIYKGVSTYIKRPYVKLIGIRDNIDLKEGDVIIWGKYAEIEKLIGT